MTPPRDEDNADSVARRLGELLQSERKADDLATAEAWAAGAISQEQAQATGGVSAETGAEQVFKPWSPAAQNDLATRMQALSASPRPSQGPATHARFPIALAPRRRSRRRWLVGGLGVGAAAAAAFLLMPAASPLAHYTFTVRAGDSATRALASATQTLRMRQDSLLELRFQPDAPVKQPVKTLLAARRRGSMRWQEVSYPPEVAASGVIRWHGTAEQVLPGLLGPVEVLLVLTTQATLSLNQAAELKTEGHSEFLVQQLELEIVSP